MKANPKKLTMLIMATIALFLIVVIGATYAYFAAEQEVGNTVIANVDTAGKTYQFTATSNGNIEMNIAFNEMSETGVSNTFLKSDNATIDVSLASPTDDILTTCTYDIVWVWDSTDMYTEPDAKPLPYTHTDDKVYNYEFSVTVDDENETDLSKLNRDDKTVTLQEGISIESNSVVVTTKTHEIRANIYNLPVEQTNLFGKNFKSHITIDNLKCSMSNNKPLATYIMNDVYNSDANQISIEAKQAGLYFHDDNLSNGAKDSTYRYAGSFSYPKASEGYNTYNNIIIEGHYDSANYLYSFKLAFDKTNTEYSLADAEAMAISGGYLKEAVNNYICFLGDDCSDENNLYRIISVDSKTNQTKVIKATSIGNMPWDKKADGSYTNAWIGSTLEAYLNGTYLTGLGEKAEKIVFTEWSVGGAAYNAVAYNNVKGLMDIELNKTTKLTRKIGLMYLNEYGFAALPEYWANALDDYNPRGYDWTLTSSDLNIWTILRYTNYDGRSIFIKPDEGKYYSGVVYGDWYAVHPAFVLSSDVKITNANTVNVGSKTNPMIII